MLLIKHIKNSLLNKRFLYIFLLAVFFFALTATGGCGKRGAPQPPVERIPQRVQISGTQLGNKVNLNWQMPARNAAEGSLLNISRVEVYRLAEDVNSPLNLTAEEFSSKSTVIASIALTDSDFARKTFTYTDTLEFAGQPVRLRYSIRFVNDSGQRAAFSNYFLIEPTAKIANAPGSVNVKITETALVINWTAPQTNVDNSTPPNILGYNIYRSAGATDNFALLNKTVVNAVEFSDTFFEFGQQYKYFVRTVSLGSNGEPVESESSKIAESAPKDVYAPSAPTAITIAAAPNTLSLFFAVNPETDIAGYRIYRSENQDLPKTEWKLLTPALLTTNTFQDKNVEAGKTYFYYLTAVDKTGNVSEPSEIVSETAP